MRIWGVGKKVVPLQQTHITAIMILYPNAKINIGLNVVERRKDGYHNLETVFFPLQLHDTLRVEKLIGQAECVLRADGLTVDCAVQDNLIVRTFEKMKHLLNGDGIVVDFHKHIPFGAGLGGGSSDAAHTAIAINELYALGLTKQELIAIVRQLGADCAFFVENTPCLATGIGDVLNPISLSLAGYTLVLVKPNVHVSTRDAYGGITPQKPARALHELIQLPIEEWRDTIHNDFEDTVFPLFPQIAAVKQQLYVLGATYASMSGSGASVFGLFRTPQAPAANLLTATFSDCFIHTETYEA